MSAPRPHARVAGLRPPLVEHALPDRGRRRGRHGSLHPAAHQRHHARLDLRADRHRLHDGVRHHRHGELRPRRRVHGVGLHRAGHVPLPHHLARHRLGRARAADRAGGRDDPHLAGQLDDRAGRLPSAARIVPAGAADLRDRHVDLPLELRAGRAGPAQQVDPAAVQPGDRADVGRRLRRRGVLQADRDLDRDGSAAGRVLVPGDRRPRSVARSAPASRTRRWRRCSASTSTARSRSPS